MTNYCHLSYEDRKNIEYELNENKSINQIIKELNRNHSTILRKIDRNRKYSDPSSWNNNKINHPNLDLSCDRLKHSPYVCNGWKSRSGCRKIRWTYYARWAQKDYEQLIKYCRQGVNLSLEEVHNINQEDCNLIMNNINSLCRNSLNGKSPYETMLFSCDECILKILDCYYIKPDEVILNNILLK